VLEDTDFALEPGRYGQSDVLVKAADRARRAQLQPVLPAVAVGCLGNLRLHCAECRRVRPGLAAGCGLRGRCSKSNQVTVLFSREHFFVAVRQNGATIMRWKTGIHRTVADYIRMYRQLR